MKQRLSLKIDPKYNDVIFAGLMALFTLILRLSVALSSTFPLNDGGLFYRMILDLQANHFILPAYTTYNNAHIPFAYPPFGLYFSGLISSGLHIDLLTLARILPSVINAITTGAFYFLARRILTKQETALAATFAFIFIPRAFEWQIVGGGLTRTFGLLFAILTLRGAYIFYHDHEAKQFIVIACFGTLTLLSHPEAVAHTAIAAAIFYIILDRSSRGAALSALTVAAILLLSAPWWGFIISQHGIDPFLAIVSAAREGTTQTLASRIFLVFQFNFTEEPFLPLISLFALIGLFAVLNKRSILLPIWVVVPLLIEPRSAPQYIALPLAMLAGIGLAEILIPAITSIRQGDPQRTFNRMTGAILSYLLIYALISTFVTDAQIINLTLKPEDIQAFDWINNNLPQGSRFIILTNGGPVYDSISEWFPALTNDTSLATVFGTEWLRNESFRQNSTRYTDLQACLFSDITCLEDWSNKYGAPYTYVLISDQNQKWPLLITIKTANNYQEIYSSSDIVVFEKTP
jgi:Dolichyl-phosphate-mannose-protein mannosyltransferase